MKRFNELLLLFKKFATRAGGIRKAQRTLALAFSLSLLAAMPSTRAYALGIPNPISNFTVREDSPSSEFDLATVFSDATDYVLLANSNPTLVDASVLGSNLILDYRDNQFGSALIRVSATDGVNTVANSFTVTVVPVNDSPVANNQSVTGNEDTVIPGTVTGSDVDVPAALTFSLASAPANGSVVLNPNGDFTYTPNANYFGTDTFTFRASDGLLLSPVATVSIMVAPVNDPPVANNLSVTGNEDAPITGSLTGSDPDGDALAFSVVSPPAHGSISIGTDGAFIYIPDVDFVGADSFTFRASDGLLFAVATVSINVIPSTSDNHPPVADINVSPDANLDEGHPEIILISVNGVDAPATLDGSASTDPDGDPLIYVWYVSSGESPVPIGEATLEPTLPTRLGIGDHTLYLSVSDLTASSPYAIRNVTVIPVADAIGYLIAKVESSSLRADWKRILANELRATSDLFAGRPTLRRLTRCEAGVGGLRVFRSSVRLISEPRIGLIPRSLATEWIYLTDQIINNVTCE